MSFVIRMFEWLPVRVKRIVYKGAKRTRKDVMPHGFISRSRHLMLFLVALLFSKLQTFLNNNPDGNPLKSVYNTPKIALTFRHVGCRIGLLVTIAIIFISLFRATKLVSIWQIIRIREENIHNKYQSSKTNKESPRKRTKRSQDVWLHYQGVTEPVQRILKHHEITSAVRPHIHLR